MRGARYGVGRRIRRSVRVRDALSAGPRTACGRPPRSRPCDRRACFDRGRAGCRTAGGGRALHRTWLVPRLVGAGERTPRAHGRGRGRPGGTPRQESERALQALYGTHAILCEVLRLRGDLPGALAHGRRAVELAEERGSVFSRVEAAAFLAAAEFADGDLTAATSVLERALALARNRRTALWYEPRILATLADAKLAAGDRSGARALLSEARELVDRGRG